MTIVIHGLVLFRKTSAIRNEPTKALFLEFMEQKDVAAHFGMKFKNGVRDEMNLLRGAPALLGAENWYPGVLQRCIDGCSKSGDEECGLVYE